MRVLLIVLVALALSAPAIAAAPGNFVTQSGSVHCQYLPRYEGIACGIEPRGLTLFLGVSAGAYAPITLPKGTVAAFPGGTVLRGGTVFREGSIVCTTVYTNTGVRCDAPITDHGFVLARGAVQRW